MKKLISMMLLSAFVLAGFNACKKNGGNGNGGNGGNGNGGNSNTITVPIDRSDTTSLPTAIPAMPNSLDFSNSPIQIDTFATKVDEYITPYGFTKDKINKVTLKSINIVIENAPNQTFNFVKSQPVSLKVLVDSFNGTAPKMIAYRDLIPTGVNTLTLDVDGSDIKDYFRADFMKIMLAFRTQENEALEANTKFRVNYQFEITAIP